MIETNPGPNRRRQTPRGDGPWMCGRPGALTARTKACDRTRPTKHSRRRKHPRGFCQLPDITVTNNVNDPLSETEIAAWQGDSPSQATATPQKRHGDDWEAGDTGQARGVEPVRSALSGTITWSRNDSSGTVRHPESRVMWPAHPPKCYGQLTDDSSRCTGEREFYCTTT
jgi:hypothetical protein